ncbi:MAG: class I SAM-dependent methyltransferase [Bacteroidetes bacterium]|nr:class I SAM-dependent methyltransferase [Bacteroidota bacterium]
MEYRLRAKSRFGIHSPFVYDFMENIILADCKDERIREIERRRRGLLRSGEILTQDDFGAGQDGEISLSGARTLRQVVRKSAVSRKFGRLLFRVTEYYKPRVILELGTSAGVSTLYLAMASPESIVHTIEGSDVTSAAAGRLFEAMGISNIRRHTGRFDDVLPGLLEEIGTSLDMVFLDGNHRYQPTLNYFHQCIPYLAPDGVFILDDIYWSPEMYRAWEEIKMNPDVSTSIDLYRMGLLFFRKGLPDQDFLIRF